MISFRDVLVEVVERVPKSLTGMIIGKDGIIVEKYQNANSSLDADLFGAEYSGVMSEVQKLVSIFHMDDLWDITISLEDYIIIIHMISEDYYFMNIMAQGSNEGLGRYKTRVGSLKLRELF